ncbi:MAG: 7-cyano-7-deazaguanine synthase [Phycisphaerales bacterium]
MPSDDHDARPELLVLLSGGIDSSALVCLYRKLRRPFATMFIDYGQAGATREQAAARVISEHYGVLLMERQLLTAGVKSDGEVPMRNAMLLSIACMERPETIWGIAIGIHSGTPYADCSPEFASAAQTLATFQTHPVRILAPFARWTKSDILAFCLSEGVPTHLTYSCEWGAASPCGKCLSCLDRKDIDAASKVEARP